MGALLNGRHGPWQMKIESPHHGSAEQERATIREENFFDCG
jgi:hypothetical protein